MTRTFNSLEEMVSVILFLPRPFYKTTHKLDPLTVYALHNSSSAIVADHDLVPKNINEKPVLDIAFASLEQLHSYFDFEREKFEIVKYPLSSSAKHLVDLLNISDLFVCKPTSPIKHPYRNVVLSHLEADVIEIISKLRDTDLVMRDDELSITLDCAVMTAISLFHSIYHNNIAILHEAIPGLCWHLQNEKLVLDTQYALREKRLSDLPHAVQLALQLHISLQGEPKSIQFSGVLALIDATLMIHPLRKAALSIAFNHIDSELRFEGQTIISHLTAKQLSADEADSIISSPVYFSNDDALVVFNNISELPTYEGENHGERI